MKTLTLVRHAKSDWGHDGLMDIDRPLNSRGYQDAYSMSQWFMMHFPVPQQIVSSPATRNLSTSFIFARTFKYAENTVQIHPDIYEASDKVLTSVIAGLDNAFDDIMLFGHNASLTNVCNTLVSDLFFENIPTCGIVRIQFGIGRWDQAPVVQGKTIAHQFPKNFRQDM